ncbi:DUF5060 domain-containing protein [Bacteroidales bacterium OttesenSCG-928-L03]|nr:DUF5060 domain-containing protein [Bacteroidales bacterium OttesenSCG-928-L03]
MRSLLTVLCLLLTLTVFAQTSVRQWDRFELELKGKDLPGSFTEVTLAAVFTHADTTFTVDGFYDGKGRYLVRFMPHKPGEWTYVTTSNMPELDQKTGAFSCTAPGENVHGPVRVRDTYLFEYADGTPYYPFGTTAYAWTHMPDVLQTQTLNSLKASAFNKLRMCVFPKNYNLVKEEPTRFPFVRLTAKDKRAKKTSSDWDFTRFDPEFFHHLEKQIDALRDLGIEADLILFHPYDKGRWGFDSMESEEDVRYLKYITARLASFRNVWWSMANEYDYLTSKSERDWELLTYTVTSNDPYRHLCSIHGSTAKYAPYWNPEYTHVSVQDEGPVSDFGRAATVRNIYYKPVVFDEVCYEGNLSSRWGRLSGEEMLHNIWQGLLAGTYVTHGECFQGEGSQERLFWAKGGELVGSSWRRIGFTRSLIESYPNGLQLADVSRDNYTATGGEGSYLVYLGKEVRDTWLFDLPSKNADYEPLKKAGKRFRVEIIDTWDMTVTEYPVVFETTEVRDYRVYDKEMRKVRLPLKPYLALRITEL